MSKPGQPKEGTKTRGEARGSAGGQKGLPREGGNTPGNRPRARKQTWPLNTYRRKKAPWYTKLRGPVAPKPKFDVDRASDYRTAKQVESAAIVVVGNEIVLGKRRDINSHYFAQYCKNLAIRLGKIEVVRDDEGDIAEAVTRLAGRYDLVVVTGGIGPTDNDKTYAAVANAFGLSLQVHQDSLQRMEAYNATRRHLANLSDEKRQQRMKLVTLPSGPGVEVLHVARNIWTPVVRIQQKVALLPGDPAIYQDLVERLKPYLNIPSIQKRRV